MFGFGLGMNFGVGATGEPAPADQAVITFTLLEGATPIEGATVEAFLDDPDSTIAAGALAEAAFSGVTDSNGQCVFNLPWSDSFVEGDGIYRVRAKVGCKTVHDRRVTVPSVLNANYDELPTA